MADLDNGESSDSDSDDAVGVGSAGRAGALPSGVAGGRASHAASLRPWACRGGRLVAAEDVLGRSPQVGVDGAGPPPPPCWPRRHRRSDASASCRCSRPRRPRRRPRRREPSLLRRGRVAAGEPVVDRCPGSMGSRDTWQGHASRGRPGGRRTPRLVGVVRRASCASAQVRGKPANNLPPAGHRGCRADLSHTVTLPDANLGLCLITIAPAGSWGRRRSGSCEYFCASSGTRRRSPTRPLAPAA